MSIGSAGRVGPCGEEAAAWGPALPVPVLVRTDRAWEPLRTGDSCEVTPKESGTGAEVASEGSLAAGVPRPAAPQVSVALVVVSFASALAFVVAGFYARLAPERGLEHPRRAAIVEHVRCNPGIETNQVARGLGLHPSKAAYHVHRLSSTGILVVRRVGGRTALFLPGQVPRDAGTGLALLRREKMAGAHALLLRSPGLDQESIAAALGCHQSRVSRILRVLMAAGLVTSERFGVRTRYVGRPLVPGESPPRPDPAT